MPDEWNYSGDPSTSSKDAVRFLIPDTDETNPILLDKEIEYLVTTEGTVKLAAAAALEVIASQEALVLKVIKVLDLQTDGAKTADALLKRADRLRAQDTADVEDDDAGFEVAEMVYDDFSYRERIANEIARGG